MATTKVARNTSATQVPHTCTAITQPSYPLKKYAGSSAIEGLERLREALEAVATLLEYRADLQNDNPKLADDGGAFVRGLAVAVLDCAAQAERYQMWLR